MTIVAAALLISAVAGCSRDRYVADVPAELIHAMEDYIGYVDGLADALEGISDADSAKAVLDDIEEAVSGMAISKAILADASVRRQVRLELRYETQIGAARVRVSREAVRLMSKKPTALVLRKALARVPVLLRSAVSAGGR